MFKDIRTWPLSEEFSSIDIEGDGYPDNRPLEICIIDFSQGRVVDTHYWLINTERPIDPYVSEHIHGITDAMVSQRPTHYEVAAEVEDAIRGKTIVGHAIDSDLRILRTIISIPEALPARIVDTAILAKLALQADEKVSLRRAQAALNIAVPSVYKRRPQFHSAPEDAYLAGQLLLQLPTLLPDDPSIIKQVSHNIFKQANRQKKRERLQEQEPPTFTP